MRIFGASKLPEAAPGTTAVVPAAVALHVRRRRDKEFLPAALEIIETPPSPVVIALLGSICLFVLAAVVWSTFARLDIVAVATGKIQPEGRVKTIQPVETGRVTSVAVSNGTHVDANAVLLTLDPAVSDAEMSGLLANLVAFQAESLRRTVAIREARGTSEPTIEWPDGTAAAVQQRENAVLSYDLGQLRATVANLRAQMAQKRAEGKRLEATIAAQIALISTLKERLDMRTLLATSGSATKASVIDARESLQTQEGTLAYQNGQRDESLAAVAVIQSDIEKTFDSFVADNGQRRAQAERQADDYGEKLRKARASAAQLTITTPIAGVVQGSRVTTIGQVVTVGEEIMRIVPDGSKLEIEAYLPNKDIGFVQTGQEAVIKIESFPYTRYGTLRGTVARVATDAIPQPEADATERSPAGAQRDTNIAGGQSTRDLVFPMTIALDTATIEADGRRVALSPGMAVTAEVKTGSRRMISYLLSPVLDVTSSAMRER